MPEMSDFGYKPPSLRTWKGLSEASGIARHRITSRLAPAFLDVVCVGALWLLVTYLVSWILWQEIRYFLVPGWLFIVGTVEIAALWESFGRSFGQKISGKQLATSDLSPPTFIQRFTHYILWHVTVLPVIGLAWRHPLHERVSGVESVSIIRGDEKPAPWFLTTSGVFVVALTLVALIAAFAVTVGPNTWTNFLSNYGRAGRIIAALFKPNHSLWPNGIASLFETIFMALMATFFAVLFAVPLSFFAARNLSTNPVGRLVYVIIRGALSIMRSIQPIIWAILFLVWVGTEHAPFAGFLALFLHSIADLTKLYAERLESIDDGPIEAITSTGGSWISVLRYAVVPQIINPYISFTLYRWDINIRMATVLGLVGAGGIGQPLIRYLQGQRFQEAAIYIYLIAALVWGIDAMSSRLRRYFDEGHAVDVKKSPKKGTASEAT